MSLDNNDTLLIIIILYLTRPTKCEYELESASQVIVSTTEN